MTHLVSSNPRWGRDSNVRPAGVGQFVVVANVHPLRGDKVFCHLDEGVTIRQIVGDVDNIRCEVNGVALSREFWHIARPKAGTLVYIEVIPQDPISALVTFATTFASAWYVGHGIQASLLLAGGITALQQLAQVLIRPPELSADAIQPVRRLDSLTGVQNRVVPFGVVPRVYGTMKFFPPIPMTARPYTETLGDEQYLRSLFVIGYGPLDFAGVKITSSDLRKFDSTRSPVTVMWHTIEGSPPTNTSQMDTLMDPEAQTENIVTNLLGLHETGSTELEDEVRIAWSQNNAPEAPDDKPTFLPQENYGVKYETTFYAPETGTYTFGLNSNQSCDLFINNTLVVSRYNVSSYSGSPTTGTINLNEGKHSIRLRFVTLNGTLLNPGDNQEGIALHWQKPSDVSLEIMPSEYLSLSILLDPALGSAITIGNTPLNQLTEVQVELGNSEEVSLYTDQVFEQRPEVTYEFVIPGWVKADTDNFWAQEGTQQVVRTTETDTDEISIDIEFPNALYSISERGNGPAQVMVEFQVEIAPTGSGSWTILEPSWQIKKRTHRAFRVGKSWEVDSGQYDIRLTRMRTWSARSASVSADAVFSALRSIRRNRRAFVADNVIVMAMRVKASEQFNQQVLDNVGVKVGSYLDVYDPNTETWTEQLTANPAWAFADVWTGIANDEAIDKTELDADALVEWATWCTDNTTEFHYIYDADNTVLKVAQEVATTGRAAWLLRDDGKISVARDFAQPTPIAVISPSNSYDYSMTRTIATQPHALRVQFIDPETFEDTERFVFADGYDESNATIYETLQTRGVKSSDQAWREGRYHLAQIQLRPEVHSWRQNIRAITYQKGDNVVLAQDTIGVGLGYGVIHEVFRNPAGDAIGVLTDEPLFMEPSKSYAMRIERADGTLALQNIENATPQTNEPIFTTPVTGLEAGYTYLYGEVDKVDIEVKVTEITRDEDFEYTIVAVPAAPEIENADEGAIPPFNPFITQPIDPDKLAPLAPEITEIRSDESVLLRDVDGSFRARAEVFFKSFASPGSGTRVQVRYRPSSDTGTQWVMTPQIEPSEGSIILSEVVEDIEYRVQIRALRIGASSEWSPEVLHTIIGKSSPPADVTGFTATVDEYTILLAWDANLEPDIKNYEIRKGLDWETADFIDRTDALKLRRDVTVTGVHDFLIKALDTSGNESTNAASASVTIQAGTVTSLTSQFRGDSVVLEWTGVRGEFPIKEFEIRRDGNFIAISNTTSFSFKVDWAGTQTWTVAAIDAAGNKGPTTGIDVTITLPIVNTLTGQVVDNNVLLQWGVTPGSLPISHYEVRKGDVLTSATVVGTADTTFTVIFETIKGLFKYWVVPVDTAGNEGTERSRSLNVDEPPDFVLHTQEIEDPDWGGEVSTNTEVDAGDLLVPFPAAEIVSDKETIHGFTTPQAQIDAGYPYVLQPTPQTAIYENVFDTGTVIASARILHEFIETPVQGTVTKNFQISHSNTSATGPWVDLGINVSEALGSEFRWVKIRYDFDGGNDQNFTRLERASTTIRTKEKNDAGKITTQLAGKALKFNGTSDYVQIPAGMHPTGDAAWTVEFWAHIDPSEDVSGRQGWAYWKNGSSPSTLAAVGVNSGEWEVAFFGNDHNSLGPVNFGRWQHVAVVYDPAIAAGSPDMFVYLDGVLSDSREVGPLSLTDDVITLASRNAASEFLNGILDDVRVWSSPRTQQQIQDNMELTLEGTEPQLVGYWNLNEGSGTTVGDSTSNNNDGVINGATWVEERGDKVTFNRPFLDVRSITLTVAGAQEQRTAIYDFVDEPNPSHFRVLVFDQQGTRVAGDQVSWAIRGV